MSSLCLCGRRLNETALERPSPIRMVARTEEIHSTRMAEETNTVLVASTMSALVASLVDKVLTAG